MAGQLTIDTLKASSGVLGTQNGMTGICKAWCKFNGTAVTITASYNVSSVTRSATGQYQLNFTTAMPDANYAVAGVVNDNQGIVSTYLNTQATTYSQISTWAIGSNYNFSAITVIYCGN